MIFLLNVDGWHSPMRSAFWLTNSASALCCFLVGIVVTPWDSWTEGKAVESGGRDENTYKYKGKEGKMEEIVGKF